jgi:hypothetical protein
MEFDVNAVGEMVAENRRFAFTQLVPKGGTITPLQLQNIRRKANDLADKLTERLVGADAWRTYRVATARQVVKRDVDQTRSPRVNRPFTDEPESERQRDRRLAAERNRQTRASTQSYYGTRD